MRLAAPSGRSVSGAQTVYGRVPFVVKPVLKGVRPGPINRVAARRGRARLQSLAQCMSAADASERQVSTMVKADERGASQGVLPIELDEHVGEALEVDSAGAGSAGAEAREEVGASVPGKRGVTAVAASKMRVTGDAADEVGSGCDHTEGLLAGAREGVTAECRDESEERARRSADGGSSGGTGGRSADAPTPGELRDRLELAMSSDPANIPRLRDLLCCLPGAVQVGYAGLGELPETLNAEARACMGALLGLYVRGATADELATEGVDSASCPLPAMEAFVRWGWAGVPVGADEMEAALVAAGGRITRARDGSQIVMFGRVRTTVAEALACAAACGATALGGLRASAQAVPPASCAPLYRRVWPAVAGALADVADERLRMQLRAARSAWYADSLAKGTLCCPHCGQPIVAEAG